MTKPQVKESITDQDWKEEALTFAKQGSLLVLQGVLFGLGGILASNLSGRISSRSTSRAIQNSKNVIEFSKSVNSKSRAPGMGLINFNKENLMKRDNRDYVCDLIKRTENKLGIDFHVDWVGFDPISILWDSASYCVQDKNGAIIFIPRTKERSDLREIVFHELAHAYAHNYSIPKYVTNIFVEFLDMPYLQYQYRILKYYSGDRRIGYISRYAEVNPEEDFAEKLEQLEDFLDYPRKFFFRNVPVQRNNLVH